MCDSLNVLDKDGISAMVVGAEMCAYLKSIGRTLYEQLNQISLLYGYHINDNSYVICNKTDVMLKMFNRLRHYDQKDDQTKQVNIEFYYFNHLFIYSRKILKLIKVNEVNQKFSFNIPIKSNHIWVLMKLNQQIQKVKNMFIQKIVVIII
jgi:phosphomannomutase